MAAADMFSVNELYPEQLDPQPAVQGTVLDVDTSRAAQGIFVYTVACEHPVTHCSFTLYGVRERVDVYYKNQVGQIKARERVHVQRNRFGVWEIDKVEPVEGGNVSPTRFEIGGYGDRRGYIVADADVTELKLGTTEQAATITSTPNNVEIRAGVWRERFEGSDWILTNNTIEFITDEDGPTNDRYSQFKIIDPSRQPTPNRSVHAMTWDAKENYNIAPSADNYVADSDGDLVLPVVGETGDDFDTDNNPNARNRQANMLVPGLSGGRNIIGWVRLPARLATMLLLDYSSTAGAGLVSAAASPSVAAERTWGPPRFHSYEIGQVPVRNPLRPGSQYTNTFQAYRWYAPADRVTTTNPPTGLPNGWQDSDYEDLTYTLEETVLDLTTDAEIKTFLDGGFTLTGFTTRFSGRPAEARGNDDSDADDREEWETGSVSFSNISEVLVGGLALGAVSIVLSAGIAAPAIAGLAGTFGTTTIMAAQLALPGISSMVITPITVATTATTVAVITATGASILVPTGAAIGIAGGGLLAANQITADKFKTVSVQGFRISASHPKYGLSVPEISYIASAQLADGYDYRTTS